MLELTEVVMGMDKYIHALKRHVAENPPNYGSGIPPPPPSRSISKPSGGL